jgi:hypothetical protein
MRNVGLVLLTWLLGTTIASAQTGVVTEGPWANKLFPDGVLTHDFGSVPRGSLLYHRFEVQNVYEVPLELNVRVGCHCVTAVANPRVLQKLEKGTIDITMDAHRFTGHKSVNVYVTTGPQFISTATLQVTANSRTDVVLNPGQITFGVVGHGQQSPNEVIDVEYAGVLDWRVSEVVPHQEPLEVTFKELYRRPGQVGYRVTVAVRPEAPPGPFKHELLLKTNDPASPLVPILVEGTVQASLTVSPGTLPLGTLRVGESVAKRVIVRGSKPFRVVAVEGADNGLTAELPAVASPVQFVLLKYQAAQAGTLHKQLQIKTDLAGEGPVTVLVEGTVEP